MPDSPLKANLREFLDSNANKIIDAIPFAREIGFEITDVRETTVVARLPYKDKIVAEAESGIIAGGVITTLLDSLCGLSCGLRMGSLGAVATLDLRIDYMRAATPYTDIIAEAECYHKTRSVCFSRAIAYHIDPSDTIATAAGAFAITAPDGASDNDKTAG
ncbi:MAG: PaaI family thioesterase [Pseudomonadota bacterium]